MVGTSPGCPWEVAHRSRPSTARGRWTTSVGDSWGSALLRTDRRTGHEVRQEAARPGAHGRPGVDGTAHLPLGDQRPGSIRVLTQKEIGDLKIKISGCINACGHHHVGHIGILGLDRAGVENYQITLGGDGTEEAALGDRTGPGFAYDEITDAIERIVRAYLALREDADETFLMAYRRVGADPFKAALYPEDKAAKKEKAEAHA